MICFKKKTAKRLVDTWQLAHFSLGGDMHQKVTQTDPLQRPLNINNDIKKNQ